MSKLTEIQSYLGAVLANYLECYIVENAPISFIRIVFSDIINREQLIIIADVCAHYEANYHVQLNDNNQLTIVIQ